MTWTSGVPITMNVPHSNGDGKPLEPVDGQSRDTHQGETPRSANPIQAEALLQVARDCHRQGLSVDETIGQVRVYNSDYIHPPLPDAEADRLARLPFRVVLDHERSGSRVRVTALWHDKIVHIDILDLARASSRERFANDVVQRQPGAKVEDIEDDLLQIAGMVEDENNPAVANESDPAPATELVELDISRIIRPEQFVTPDVTGLVVPIVIERDGKPVARWMAYRQWMDGHRECVGLTDSIDLPTGQKLWVHPQPGEPSITTTCGWSLASRQAWLAGPVVPNPAELFACLCERIAHFLDFQVDVAAATTATLALWSMLTYWFQAWPAVPYLYVGGPAASGKSRCFEVLFRLVYRALQSSNLTAPTLFRTLHDRGGTLLFDEAERLKQSSPEVGETLSMLLAGYKRGGQATRLEAVGDSFRTVFFDVYGPKALACIAGLPSVLATRCITIMMFRASPDSVKPRRRIDADPAGWQQLRDDLHTTMLEFGPIWLELSGATDVCPQGVSGRDYELWQPLLALASWVESHGATGLLTLMQEFAKASIAAAKDDQVSEADEMLLELLTEAVKIGEPPTPGELLASAQERAPSTFGTSTGIGPRWQASTVTKRLKTYGIPVPRKSNGERRYRDVTLAELRKIQQNYGIDLGIVEPPRAS
jgi:hypothetical protein